jgi:SAM-dependent methyltransferase
VNVRLAIGRRFARIATMLVVLRPTLWRLLRRPMELEFDLLASRWETMPAEHSLAPLVAALETVQAPRRALDLRHSAGAFAIAERFPDAEVVGVDLSGKMVAEARRKLRTPRDRVHFEQADASCLSFEDGAFDLVVLLNMISFFDEVARVIRPGGHAVFVFVPGRRPRSTSRPSVCAPVSSMDSPKLRNSRPAPGRPSPRAGARLPALPSAERDNEVLAADKGADLRALNP